MKTLIKIFKKILFNRNRIKSEEHINTEYRMSLSLENYIEFEKANKRFKNKNK